MRKFSLLLFVATYTVNFCCSQCPESDIVLISVGNYDKRKIAEDVAIITRLNPRVVSLDIAFPNYIGDPDDKKLASVLQDINKLVVPSVIHYEGIDYSGKEIITVVSACAFQFAPDAKKGFVSAKKDEESISPTIPAQFIVWQQGYTGDIYHHFSLITAMAFDSLKATKFIRSNERLVDVNFRNGMRKFQIFSHADVVSGKLTNRDIEGKIVMMGFLGPGNEDKFFLPMNTDSKEPDMYGVEYLANIVAQVLEDN